MTARTKHGLSGAEQGRLLLAKLALEDQRRIVTGALLADCNSPDSLNDVIDALEVLANAELQPENPE